MHACMHACIDSDNIYIYIYRVVYVYIYILYTSICDRISGHSLKLRTGPKNRCSVTSCFGLSAVEPRGLVGLRPLGVHPHLSVNLGFSQWVTPWFDSRGKSKQVNLPWKNGTPYNTPTRCRQTIYQNFSIGLYQHRLELGVLRVFWMGPFTYWMVTVVTPPGKSYWPVCQSHNCLFQTIKSD